MIYGLEISQSGVQECQRCNGLLLFDKLDFGFKNWMYKGLGGSTQCAMDEKGWDLNGTWVEDGEIFVRVFL